MNWVKLAKQPPPPSTKLHSGGVIPSKLSQEQLDKIYESLKQNHLHAGVGYVVAPANPQAEMISEEDVQKIADMHAQGSAGSDQCACMQLSPGLTININVNLPAKVLSKKAVASLHEAAKAIVLGAGVGQAMISKAGT